PPAYLFTFGKLSPEYIPIVSYAQVFIIYQAYLLHLFQTYHMRQFILLLLSGLFIFFGNCTKDTKGKTITVTDTVYVEVRHTTIIPALISDTTTTVIVLRHAEKEIGGADPNLNSDGVLRAEELKRILQNIPIAAVYSTSFIRTKKTVEPLAIAKGLT